MSYLHLSTVKALTCISSAGGVPDAKAKDIDEIIDVSTLPPAFLEPDFKHFRIATKKVDGKKIQKISINVDPDAEVDADTKLGQYMHGDLESRPLYSINELRSFGSIPNAEFLQFVPKGTFYSVLDFDSDKTKPDEFRSNQVRDVVGALNKGQFGGIIELSASGLGLHAYVKDINMKELPKDPYAFEHKKDGDTTMSFEMFAGNAPIVLTGDVIEKADTNDGVDTLPKFITDLIDKRLDKDVHTDKIEPSTVPASDTLEVSTSTEEKTYAVVTEDEDRAIKERFKKIDQHDRLNVGYGDSNDPSEVDFGVATMMLKTSYGNKPYVIRSLISWMSKWRPHSSSPIKKATENATAKEIARLAGIVVKNAYINIEKTEPILTDEWQEQAQEEKDGITPHPFTNAKDIEMKAPEWIIKGFVQKGEFSMSFGDPESGKSLIMLDMAVAVSNGTPWRGNRTEKLTVLYLAGEGSQGIRRRLKAIELSAGADIVNILISDRPGALIDEKSTKEIAEAIKNVNGDVWLLIDTLHRNIGDGDESSSSDFGKMMSNMDKHIMPLGATASFVHHSGHGNKGRSRGTSSIRGSMDSEFQVTKENDMITMSCTKMKDAVHPNLVTFKLKVVDLGFTDEDGDEYTSVCLEPVEKTGFEIMMEEFNLPLGSTLALQFYRENDENKALIDEKNRRTHGAFSEWLKTSECPVYFEGKSDTKRTLRRDIDRLRDKGLIPPEATSTGEKEPTEVGSDDN